MFIKQNTKKGFTLIEMLVSIALFSVVLTITLGAILTIADSNKKARSLMSVTNNLNFAIDSMTRSIKSGDMGNNPIDGGGCFTTDQINYSEVGFARENVTYCLDAGTSSITQQIGSGAKIPLTSEDVTIDYLEFEAITNSVAGLSGNQPRVLIVVGGTVKVSEKISSEFSIQTTVAQRQLNI